MDTTQKEYKRTALILALIFFLLVLLMLLLMSFVKADPPFSSEQLEMVELDFSGGGGSEGAVSESTSEENNSSLDQPEDPVETHEDPESPVEKPDEPVSDGTSDQETEDQSNNPSNDFSNIFGNGSSNSGNGNDNDGDNGSGTGSGPNIGSGTGKMGSGRDLLETPKEPKNPITAIGVVMVKIFVKKDGTVDPARTQVLHDHPKTTSTYQEHWTLAKKTANKYKFEKISAGKKLEYTTIKITFTSG